MNLATFLFTLCFLLYVPHAFGDSGLQCNELSCMSRDQLLDVIQGIQLKVNNNNNNNKRKKLVKTSKSIIRSDDIINEQAILSLQKPEFQVTSSSCDICGSNPCGIGGTCYADPDSPLQNFTCVCEEDYVGNLCETKLECLETTCGKGADCSVNNNRINCVCPFGLTGDPFVGCNTNTVVGCVSSDPMYTTYDGLYYNYDGTCRYLLTCVDTIFKNKTFYIVGKNEFLSNTSKLTFLNSVNVLYKAEAIGVNHMHMNTTFNYEPINLPFYWPNASHKEISLTRTGSTNILLTTIDGFRIDFFYGGLCVQIPDIPAYQGDTMVGLLGNIDRNSTNDIKHRFMGYTAWKDKIEMNKLLDTWASDYHCVYGETLATSNYTCDTSISTTTCQPILDVINATGIFKKCRVMGDTEINAWYNDCIHTVCNEPTLMCTEFKNFVDACSRKLRSKDLPVIWREQSKCPKICPPNSSFKECATACPTTCADLNVTTCDKACVEDCQCDVGYILDNTKTSTVCIPVEKCGCTDEQGRFYADKEIFVSPNCSVKSQCIDQTQVILNTTACSEWAECDATPFEKRRCKCKRGYKGDGYICEDINECENYPTLCNAHLGQGKCINTNGSFECSCASNYYEFEACSYYRPRRHCADLKFYHNEKTNGWYSIRINYTSFSKMVYCDMETDGGGWTLVGTDIPPDQFNLTHTDYKNGFGYGNGSTKYFLGLDSINNLTKLTNQSLRVEITRCPNGKLPTSAHCTYPVFSVLSEDDGYAVHIPEMCAGNDTTFEGWVRWNLNKPGPAFTTFDRDGAFNCSKRGHNLGFWYDNTYEDCGTANLLGEGYSCDSAQSIFDTTYASWSSLSIASSKLFLRPTLYPDYDIRLDRSNIFFGFIPVNMDYPWAITTPTPEKASRPESRRQEKSQTVSKKNRKNQQND